MTRKDRKDESVPRRTYEDQITSGHDGYRFTIYQAIVDALPVNKKQTSTGFRQIYREDPLRMGLKPATVLTFVKQSRQPVDRESHRFVGYPISSAVKPGKSSIAKDCIIAES